MHKLIILLFNLLEKKLKNVPSRSMALKQQLYAWNRINSW